MTRHWRLNCFCAFTMSVLWCLSRGSEGSEDLSSSSERQGVSNGPQNPSPPILLSQEILF